MLRTVEKRKTVPRITPAGAHQFIKVGRYHRNERAAEEYAFGLFREIDPEITLERARITVKSFDLGGKIYKVSFAEVVRMARERGTAESLRGYLNVGEAHFPLSLASAIDDSGITVTIGQLGETTRTMVGPTRLSSIELDFADDILAFRRLASESSYYDNDGFASTCRHLRSYILASCALFEVFLNRSVIVALRNGQSSPDLDELSKPTRLERRLEVWLREFCGVPLSYATNGAEWDAYQKLRAARNFMVHADKVLLDYSLREVAYQLNLVRLGVGGFIALLRRLQGRPPLPFAERLETAPLATFVSRVS
jgi:hypothetical protein